KVAGGDAPRPKSLHSGFIRYFLEAAFAEVLEEGVSEQNLRVANLEGTRGLLAVPGEDVPVETRALGRLEFAVLDDDIRRLAGRDPHIRMHVYEIQVEL